MLALRGLIGDAEGADQFDLPPDQRFYAGGSATVRGYNYQSVGPQFPDSNNRRAAPRSLAGTVEFRQRIFDSFGAAVFVDAGQVAANGPPVHRHSWRVGAGVGARYYTSIGPIRLDVAVPLNQQPGGGFVRVLYRHRAGLLMRRRSRSSPSCWPSSSRSRWCWSRWC